MYSDYNFQHLDITLDTKCQEKDVFTVVQKLRPNWDQSDVQIKRIIAGFMNQTFTVLHKEDMNSQKDGLFVRVNGKNGKAVERLFVNRQHEIRYLKEMNKHKIGAPLLATFNNGIVLKFVKGNIVSVEQLENPELERKVAKILAEIHVIPVPDDMPRNWELKEGLLRCLNELDKDSNVDVRYKADYADGIRREFEEVTKWIESCNIPIELNHWDCDAKNMIYNEETGLLTLVDYECASTQIFTHDLGRYFLGYLGIPFDFTKYPDDARMKQFVRFYLEEKYKLLQKPMNDLNEDTIEQIFYWAQLSYMFMVFFLGVYSVWRKNNIDSSGTPVPVDFDMFTKFTKPCMNEYFRMKLKLQQK